MKATRLLLALVALVFLATLGSCTRTRPGPACVPGSSVNDRVGPRIINVLPLTGSVGLYRRLEIAVDFEGAFIRANSPLKILL